MNGRPMPPCHLLDEFKPHISLSPAEEIGYWIQDQIISSDGRLHNPDHAHLVEADIAFLWAATAFTKKGRTVLGQAEEVMIRAGGWQKARMEQQLYEWFGRKPDFIITLALISACTVGIWSSARWLSMGFITLRKKQTNLAHLSLRVTDSPSFACVGMTSNKHLAVIGAD